VGFLRNDKTVWRKNWISTKLHKNKSGVNSINFNPKKKELLYVALLKFYDYSN
tara:strand:- start:913 stop:1071 length:159 start_codon:yes stop_codon:yes gene_type:complete